MDGAGDLVVLKKAACNLADCFLMGEFPEGRQVNIVKSAFKSDQADALIINERLDRLSDILLRLGVLVDVLDVENDFIDVSPARG